MKRKIEIVPESHIDGLSKSYILNNTLSQEPVLFIELPQDSDNFYKAKYQSEAGLLEKVNQGTAQAKEIKDFCLPYKDSKKSPEKASPRGNMNYEAYLTQINELIWQQYSGQIFTQPVEVF